MSWTGGQGSRATGPWGVQVIGHCSACSTAPSFLSSTWGHCWSNLITLSTRSSSLFFSHPTHTHSPLANCQPLTDPHTELLRRKETRKKGHQALLRLPKIQQARSPRNRLASNLVIVYRQRGPKHPHSPCDSDSAPVPRLDIDIPP